MSDNEVLCRKIGYQFKDKSHLKAALTHRSVRDTNNERLEFLGDSIVNFIIAETLYRRCPRAKEGDLSRLRAFLVRGETLAEVAQAFELGEYLRLGLGELKSGGFRRKSILADALEALIAAIYLDSGLEACRERVLTWFEDYIQQATTKGTAQKDPKTRLQEHLQAQKVALPKYSVAAVDGEAHDQTFHVQCRVDSLKKVTEGVGPSRRHAEQDAAEKLLELLEKKK